MRAVRLLSGATGPLFRNTGVARLAVRSFSQKSTLAEEEFQAKIDYLESPLTKQALGEAEHRAEYADLFYSMFRSISEQHFVSQGKIRPLERAFASLAQVYIPNISDCNQMLSAFAKSGQPGKIVSLVKRMARTPSCQPDVVSFSILVDAMSRQGQVKGILLTLKQMIEAGVEPNDKTYYSAIRGLCMGGDVYNAFTVYETMLRNGIKPDAEVFWSLIKGCAIAGENEKVLEYFEVLKKHNKDVAEDTQKNRLPGSPAVKASPIPAETYHHIMQAKVKMGQYATLFDLHDEMKASGVEGNRLVFCSLLNAHLKLNQADQALELFKTIPPEHIDHVTFGYKVRAHCYLHQVDAARDTLEDLHRAVPKAVPSQGYGIVLRKLCSSDLAKAEALASALVDNVLRVQNAKESARQEAMALNRWTDIKRLEVRFAKTIGSAYQEAAVQLVGAGTRGVSVFLKFVDQAQEAHAIPVAAGGADGKEMEAKGFVAGVNAVVLEHLSSAEFLSHVIKSFSKAPTAGLEDAETIAMIDSLLAHAQQHMNPTSKGSEFTLQESYLRALLKAGCTETAFEKLASMEPNLSQIRRDRLASSVIFSCAFFFNRDRTNLVTLHRGFDLAKCMLEEGRRVEGRAAGFLLNFRSQIHDAELVAGLERCT